MPARALHDVQDGRLSPDQIDEHAMQQSLYTHDLPDPDLLIRTSGETRISNFLFWQLAYTELYFTPTLWPDFRRREPLVALDRIPAARTPVRPGVQQRLLLTSRGQTNLSMQEYNTVANSRLTPLTHGRVRFDPRGSIPFWSSSDLYAVIRYLGPLAFFGLVVTGGVLALFEFYRLCFGDSSHSWHGRDRRVGFAALIARQRTGRARRSNPRLPGLVCIAFRAAAQPLEPLEQSSHETAMTLIRRPLCRAHPQHALRCTRALPQRRTADLLSAPGHLGQLIPAPICRHTLWDGTALAPSISPKKT